jgi:putative acetyltransferase
MSSGVRIRPERPDHPEVVALLADLDRYLAGLYPPEANHILDVQALLAPGIHFLVAEVDGRIVACGATRDMPGEPDTQGLAYGEIKRMMTAPAARGQGLAARLMLALEDGLRGRGIDLAMLETGADQHEAVRLYERQGYRRRAAFGGYPDNGLSWFYEKALA